MSGYRLFPEYIVNRALHQLDLNLNNYKRTVTELSTGLRIVRAADDAADLLISDWAKQFHSSLNTAIRNIKKGLELLRTTDDALTQI
jgi:flagellin-like hook-associated protein FlgL